MQRNSERRHLNRVQSRLRALRKQACAGRKQACAGRKQASFRRWCLAAGTSLMLSWVSPPAIAQDALCDECTHTQACSTHAPLRYHSHCDRGVLLPSLQTLFVDRLSAVGDRIERRVHRHHPGLLSKKSCGHPDCTDCTAAAMGPAALGASGVNGGFAENRMQTPFANSNTPRRLPAILLPSSLMPPASSRAEARGKLTDRKTALQSESVADGIDARQLTPHTGAASDPRDRSGASRGSGQHPLGATAPAVGPIGQQPTSTRPTVASETTNRSVGETKIPELVDLAKPDATASQPTHPAVESSAPQRIERPISTARPEMPENDALRTLETISDAAPVAPPPRRDDRFRALPSAPELPFREESTPSDRDIPISPSKAPLEPASKLPAEPKPMPHQDGLPEILVDPFQDDVRAVRPNPLGHVEQSSGVQPRPFPTRGKTSSDAGSLKAKFEAAKRLNATRSPLPPAPPLMLPPAAPNR
jgi:hypothetical protein